MAELS